MFEHPLIADMREKSKSKNAHDKMAALLFALQLPSICSRCDILPGNEKIYADADGKPYDKKLYIAWLQKYGYPFRHVCVGGKMSPDALCKAIYGLRNTLTHSGNLRELNSKLILFDSDETHDDGILFSGQILYMSVSKFCGLMFDAASDTFSDDYNVRLSKADENLLLYLLPNTDFKQIEHELDLKYREFWKNRKTDLMLYRAYCENMPDRIDEIRKKAEDNPEWTIRGLSRSETERLIKVVDECDEFGNKLDAEIAKKYFT